MCGKSKLVKIIENGLKSGFKYPVRWRYVMDTYPTQHNRREMHDTASYSSLIADLL